jgi:hypothetical protein
MIRAPVAFLQLLRRHARGAKHRMARIIKIPIAVKQPPLFLQSVVKGRARIRREDVKSGGFDALRYCPLDCALEDIRLIPIHAENEASINHDAEVVKATDRFGIIGVEVLEFPLLPQGFLIDALETHEQAAQTAGGSFSRSRGSVPDARRELTVPAPCQMRSMPFMPSKSEAAKRRSPNRWSSKK